MAADIDFARMFENLPAPYMMLDSDLRFIAANEAYLKSTNSTLDQIMGEYIFDAFPDTQERMDFFKAAFEKALQGESSKVVRENYTLADEDAPGGTREVWWTVHQFPLYDTDGKIVGMVQKAQDVTANVEAERTRDVVLREFDHRMNNMLAKVSAIARRTGESYPDMAHFLPSFEARVEAMAKTQKLLIRTQWEDVDLVELAEQEFAPYRDAHDDRIDVSGPDVCIDGKVAQSLGMAFHELATNAAKYGGLSLPGGHVSLSWHHAENPKRLIIEWHETGLPDMEKMPETSGFGSMIIDKFTPVETGGTVERKFKKGEMSCTIILPEQDC